MSIYTNNKYRIKRSESQEEQMKYIYQEMKIFQDYSQILVTSAIIGFNNSLFVPIEKQASDGVLMQFFTERDYDMMDFIAYSHEKEQLILKSNKKYEIFESYANGGFPVLVSKLGIDFIDKTKNDRTVILKNYYRLLLLDDFS